MAKPAAQRGAKPKREIILALSTHWDREWYQSFQGFRYRLVQTLDKAFDLIEREPRIGAFHLDGQTIVIEDYLEIHPERAPQVQRLIKSGRVLAGPWYCMPDSWLVSTESQIRNLQLGIEIARGYGCDFREGYVCDIFGFNSQTPQIFQLLGIGSAFLFRGAGDEYVPRHFQWASPDGSEVLCHRFTDGSYCEFFSSVRSLDRAQGKRVDIAAATERALKFLADACANQQGDVCLVMDGSDHADLDPDIVPLIEAINARLDWGEVRIGTLDDFIAKRRTSAPLERFAGELRFPAVRYSTPNWLIQNTLSSYAPLKLWNRRVESLLTRWTEPFDLCARAAFAAEQTDGFLRTAWKWLLQNHPHDSICGCSIDEVHADMEFRFRQAEGLGREVLSRALEAVAGKAGLDAANENHIEIAIFNPLPDAIEDVIDVAVDLPMPVFKILETDVTNKVAVSGYPHHIDGFFGESYPLLSVRDAAGNELPYQIKRITAKSVKRELVPGAFPKVSEVERVQLTVPVRAPALGIAALTVSPRDSRKRHTGSLFQAPATLENERLRVRLDANGSLTLTDKTSGSAYSGLFVFEDCGDVGDGWFHVKPKEDTVAYSGAPTAISVVEDGPLKSTLKLSQRLMVPARIDRASNRRSAETVVLSIDVFLTVKRGGRSLEAEVVVDNGAQDHRLRVLFKTGIAATNSITSTACDLIERPIRGAVDASEHKEYYNTIPTDGVVALRGSDGRGLATLCPGIYESWVPDDGSGTIALTLLRSFHKTVMTDGETRCQIQGQHTFRIALMPLQSATSNAEMVGELDRFELGLRAQQKKRGNGPALVERSFIERVSGDFRLLALKAEEAGGFTLRGYNPSEKAGELRLRVTLPFTSVEHVDLAGRDRGPVTRSGDTIAVAMKPKQIVNLRFR